MSLAVEPSTKHDSSDKTAGDAKDDLSSTLPHLCQDVLVSILQWLPVKKLIQLELVCHLWKEVIIPRTYGKVNRISFSYQNYTSKWMPWRSNNGSIDKFFIFNSLLDRLGMHLTSVVLPRVGWSGDSLADLIQLLSDRCPNVKHLDTNCNRLPLDWLSMVPTTLDSIRIDRTEARPSCLKEFIRTHPGLQKFWMASGNSSVRDVPEWLAQYCTGVTHLSLFQYGGGQRYTPNFANVFATLVHLQHLDLSMANCFDADDLQSLGANCPNLEVLLFAEDETVEIVDVRPILKLKKLRRLDLRKLTLSDKSVAELCEAVGAKLEFLQFYPNCLTDASLMAISHNCPNLVDLRFYMGRDWQFTQNGMAQLVETLMRHPIWNGRKLSVASMQPNIFDKVDPDKYGGIVVLTQFAMGHQGSENSKPVRYSDICYSSVKRS